MMPRKRAIYAIASIILMLSIPRAHVQAAASPFHINAFYATTQAANDAFNKDDSKIPPHVTAFPAGTAAVGYYIDYSGAKPKVTQFQIIQHSPDHSVFKGDVHTLHYVNGTYNNEFDQDPAFPPGTYSLVLTVHGKTLATTTFTIKAGIVVVDFYPTTKSVIDAWQASTSDDAPATKISFPAGTTDIGYYFSFVGITPKVTTFRVNIYDQAGDVVVTGGLYTLHNVAGFFGDSLHIDAGLAKGQYRMSVLMKDVPVSSTNFTVGS